MYSWQLAGCLPALPTAAQTSTSGPWVELTAAPLTSDFYHFRRTQLQSPLVSVVWAVNYGQSGMGGYTTVLSASADNGLNWQKSPILLAGLLYTRGLDVQDLWALDAQRAWLLTRDYASGTRTLWQTTTGPTGFAVMPTQPPGTILFIRFFDAATAIAVGSTGSSTTGWQLFRTTTGGQSWQLAPGLPTLAAGDQPVSCTMLGAHLWVNTTKGNLLHTSDAGLTWSSAPTPQLLKNLAFRDVQHGLANGDPLVYAAATPLYRTADGGATWQLVNATGPRRLENLAAFTSSAGTYLSVGNGQESGDKPGTAVSYNDGQTWQDLGGTAPLDYVCTNSAGQAWAAYDDNGLPLRLGSTALPTIPAQVATTLLAYPTPTTGPLQLPAAGDYQRVTVYDAAGRQCRIATLGALKTTIDLRDLGAGLYLIRFTDGPAAPLQQRIVVQ